MNKWKQIDKNDDQRLWHGLAELTFRTILKPSISTVTLW